MGNLQQNQRAHQREYQARKEAGLVCRECGEPLCSDRELRSRWCSKCRGYDQYSRFVDREILASLEQARDEQE